MNNINKNYKPLEELVELIARKTNRMPRVCGRGFQMLCPAHEDKNPSLSVSEGNEGIIVMRCFAHCTVKEICDAIGIPVSSLFPRNKKRTRR